MSIEEFDGYVKGTYFNVTHTGRHKDKFFQLTFCCVRFAQIARV